MDEARHVAFGRLAVTQAERDKREEFVVEACVAYVEGSTLMQEFRRMLFSRIVPTVKDIGLWGERVQRAYEDMGVLGYQDADPDALSEQDESLAQSLDASRGLSPESEAAARTPGVDAKRAREVEETIRLGTGEDQGDGD